MTEDAPFCEVVLLIVADPGSVHGAAGYIHVPQRAQSGLVPDSPELWDVIWHLRGDLLGIAHTHPPGCNHPSQLDLETARSVERALGCKLRWWIVDPASGLTTEWRHASAAPEDRGYTTVQHVLPPGWARLAAMHAYFAGSSWKKK